jgi:hypothetical protein
MKCRARLSILLLILCSCSQKGPIYSDENVSVQISRYYKTLAEHVRFEKQAATILHRAGSFQEYAKNINCAEFGKAVHEKDISDLMDTAFKEYKTDAIEIDIRTIPGSKNHHGVYIVHDRIDPEIEEKNNPEANGYLSRNSVQQVIAHFIRSGYPFKGNSLYIELKVPRQSVFSNNTALDADEKQYIALSLAAIDSAVRSCSKSEAEIKKISDRIQFISFNIFALEEVHNMCGETYGLHFLAATNRPVLGRFAAARDYELNFLNSALIDKLTGSDWLDGLWFDPRGIDDAARIFNSINDKRHKPLEIHIFAYELPFTELVSKIIDYRYSENGTLRKLEHVKGLCFEVQKYHDENKQASCE